MQKLGPLSRRLTVSAFREDRAKGEPAREGASATSGRPNNPRTTVVRGVKQVDTRDPETGKIIHSTRKSTVAVILGGGESDRRLFPLTEKRALPAVPVGGAYRLIDIPMSNCLHGNINKIYVLTQYNSQSLNRYITRTYGMGEGVPLGGDGFVEVLATTQYPSGETRWAAGNADAVRLMSWVFDHPRMIHVDYVLVLPADQLYRANFEELIEYHRKQHALLTVVAHPAPAEGIENLGVIKVASDSMDIVDYVEKPRGREREYMKLNSDEAARLGTDDPYLASCGIYVFDRRFLLELLRDNPRAHSFGADVVPLAMEAAARRRLDAAAAAADRTLPRAAFAVMHKVLAYQLPGYWADVGASIRTYLRANLDAATRVYSGPGDVPMPFDPRVHADMVHTDAHQLPPTEMRGCHIVSSSIASGGRISSAKIYGSLIGPRAIIGANVTIRDSIIMGADMYEEDLQPGALESQYPRYGMGRGQPLPAMGIGAGSVVERGIVDKNARIGANCVIANRAGVWEAMDRVGVGICVREGVPVVTKNAVLYDGTHI